jgi:predicted dehydrogenase
MPTRRLQIGLAGLGRFGQLHARVLAQIPDVSLAAIAEPVEQARLSVLRSCPHVRVYPDLDTLLTDPDLDAIVLTTPETLHYRQGLAALEAGRHVFVEKPMASTCAEAENLRSFAARAGLILQVGLVLRYEASHQLLHRQIREGVFGELVSIRVKRNCSRAWAASYLERVPTVFETLIHDLDLMLWYTQSHPVEVTALESNVNGHAHPDATFALIRFASGTVGLAESSWFVPDQALTNVTTPDWTGTIDAELAIVGSEQTAQLRMLDTPLQIWSDRHHQAPDTGLWPLLGTGIGGALRAELEDFCRCAHRRAPSTVASVDDAVTGMSLAEAILASACRGETITLGRG